MCRLRDSIVKERRHQRALRDDVKRTGRESRGVGMLLWETLESRGRLDFVLSPLMDPGVGHVGNLGHER
jgi:hypothetical protein